MDFHKIDSDAITEEDLYKAHLRDIAVQNKHGLIYKKYYLDLHRKTAFCLMEGPNKEACFESHKEAHGVGACNVIEVSRELEFLPYMGEGGQNEKDLALTLSGEIDSGFRTIMIVEYLILQENQNLSAIKITEIIKKYKGNIIKSPSEKLIISFIDAFDALSCAVAVKEYFRSSDPKPLFGIALSTGKPVDEHSTFLFEEARAKASVMCRLGLPQGICIDMGTQLSASQSLDFSRFDATDITVLDQYSYHQLEKLVGIIQKNLNDSAFKGDNLSKALGLSKTQAYRKISSLVGMSPNRFLSELRLLYAAQELKKGGKTVSEIAYDSGFNSPTYFTRMFRKRFEILPNLINKPKSF